MTAAEFRAAKDTLGCSWQAMARALGFHNGSHCRAIARGDSPVTPTVAILLTILLKLPAARKLAGL